MLPFEQPYILPNVLMAPSAIMAIPTGGIAFDEPVQQYALICLICATRRGWGMGALCHFADVAHPAYGACGATSSINDDGDDGQPRDAHDASAPRASSRNACLGSSSHHCLPLCVFANAAVCAAACVGKHGDRRQGVFANASTPPLCISCARAAPQISACSPLS